MPIDAKSFQPIAHGAIWRCDDCGFGFVSPRPTPTETEEFYRIDKYYTQGQSHLAEVAEPTFQSRLRTHLAWRVDRGEQDLARIAQTALGQQKARICDLGCGSGMLAKRLVAAGLEVVGVERDPDAVSFQQQDFQVLAGSAEQIPTEIESGSCDGVLIHHVLEHIVEPVAALVGAARLLRPGGIMLLAVPNNECLAAQRAGLAWEHLDVPRHVNFFSAKTLGFAAEKAGLVPERNFFYGFNRMFYDSLIATEQRIHDQLAAHGSKAAAPSRRNSQWQAWRLLMRTAFSKPERKYDALGLVARKPL